MNIDLTPLLQAVITVISLVITGMLVPWLKAKLTEQQQVNLNAAIRILVYAAEQVYGAGNGDEKMEYVIERLRAKGFAVDKDAIEAAVKGMNIDSWFASNVAVTDKIDI